MTEDRDSKAQEAAGAVLRELMASKLVTEHGLTVEQNGAYLEVKTGALELAGVAFNYGGLGFCRITNFVKNFPDNAIAQYDARTISDGIVEFRRQLSLAFEIFQRNRQAFSHLGLV